MRRAKLWGPNAWVLGPSDVRWNPAPIIYLLDDLDIPVSQLPRL